MPLSYGGNIKNFDDAKKIFGIGFEKIVINSSSFKNLNLIKEIGSYFGSQSIIGSIDIKKNFFGYKQIFSHHGRKKEKVNHLEWVKRLEEAGIGELLVTSIDRDGTWKGYDIDLLKEINELVRIPIIANGGCGSLNHIKDAVSFANISACATGSMVVYQKKGMGVLINFPPQEELKEVINID